MMDFSAFVHLQIWRFEFRLLPCCGFWRLRNTLNIAEMIFLYGQCGIEWKA